MENIGGGMPDRLFRKILDGLPVGIYLCDTKGEILYINDVYADILGTLKDDLVNKNIVDVLPKTRALDVMRSGNEEIGDLCVIGEGTVNKTTIVNRLPMRDDEGMIVGMVSMCLFRNPNELKALVERVEQLDSRVSFYRRRMQSALSARYTLDNILGESKPLLFAKNRLRNYAHTDFPVLIQGPTGTGKELFANALHTASPRKDGPFVSINCAAVPIELFESELFGYVSGAFSGASKDGKVGLIELADKGTLFLDEIGDMPLAAQAKMLRVLEEKTVCRVGSSTARPVDFRLVAATNRDLLHIVEGGGFREDLYYRVGALPLQIPSLAERTSDIPLIVTALLARMGKATAKISEESMRLLMAYDWPGNIRELRNILIHAISVGDGQTIRAQDLSSTVLAGCRANRVGSDDEVSAHHAQPSKISSTHEREKRASQATSLHAQNADTETAFIVKALELNHGNMVKTAKYLNISRATLYEKCKKLGISRNKN
ncbi:sigma 54-interacting transcriptional regulator [Desulfomicrobium sp. ZS1]|uniref:sigma-54 interaction domain-containing protein n=1 Tax=Desulfomicrobium sp. ZS1 TaxID=2952228 RepID=UPI0020B30F9E|nr:sigma 54-interacting transcriptional regulator [Desulfomicrobium sp. ZS1]UTF51436.1 sigma 54-interacting transcriptional regulator [Desulfomicrobium sp. ZS1]